MRTKDYMYMYHFDQTVYCFSYIHFYAFLGLFLSVTLCSINCYYQQHVIKPTNVSKYSKASIWRLTERVKFPFIYSPTSLHEQLHNMDRWITWSQRNYNSYDAYLIGMKAIHQSCKCYTTTFYRFFILQRLKTRAK